MLLDRGLYWFDYPSNVHIESQLTLMSFIETIEGTLSDDNMPK